MSEPFLHVLYASQTGCAQSVAEDFGRLVAQVRMPFPHFARAPQFMVTNIYVLSQRLGLDVPVLPMDDFEMRMLPSLSRLVFFISTTGQGSAPDNMKKSWSFLLRKELPSNSLSATQIAVFGLGDSSYAKFNFPSKKLHARLLQLGAQPMLPLGLGDDQHVAGPYTALVPWQAALIKHLAAAAEIAGVRTQARELSVVANYSVLPAGPGCRGAGNTPSASCSRKQPHNHSVSTTSITSEYLDPDSFAYPSGMSLATIVDNKVLSKGDGREVRHMEFDWRGGVYNPGDVVLVQPQMPASDSVALLTMMGHDPTIFVEVKVLTAHATPLPICQPVSLLHLTQTCLDFWATPRRYFFELLSQYCRCVYPSIAFPTYIFLQSAAMSCNASV